MAKSKAYHNGQESAAPVVAEFDVIQSGMTKREAFAMAAMSAWIQHHGTKDNYGYSDKNTAKCAVDTADALLAELEK